MKSKYLTHCDYCEEAFSYNPGIKGEHADLTKLLFILHRSDSREPQPSSPTSYKNALLKSQTGKVLTEMLKFCNLSIEDIYLTNMFKCLLPKDREPRINEYRSCTRILEKQVNDFKPGKIVVFGHKPYKHMFPEVSKQKSFDEIVTQILNFNDIPALVSYHPRWAWSYRTEKRVEYYGIIKKFLKNPLP